mmetsp:Transcript_4553/g.7951  ORF Transcript_4553/g.7951 Transcript_4553/m.7951 type:complete len:296 (+) Transcript_4553:599-1486(+)
MHFDFTQPRRQNRNNKQGWTKHELFFHRIAGLFLWKFVPDGSHHRGSVLVSIMEKRVRVRHEVVTQLNCRLDIVHGLVSKQPRLPSLRVNVGVGSEERVKDTKLIPPCQQLDIGISEEATNVCSTECETRHSQRETHWNRNPEMVPIGRIIPSPDRTNSLRSREEGSAQHERSIRRFRSTLFAPVYQTISCCLVIEIAINVVNVTVLHIVEMQIIFLHCDFRAIKDTWLIHVVPNVQALSRPFVNFRNEQSCPPLSYLRIQHVQVHRRPRPTPSIKVSSITFLHKVALAFRLLED